MSSEQRGRDVALLETAKDVYGNKCLFWRTSEQESAKGAEARSKGEVRTLPRELRFIREQPKHSRSREK